MQPDFLARLRPEVRDFVLAVEDDAGIAIDVEPDEELNNGGPLGQGKLKVVIEASFAQLYAPTNGYFPDGAVRHEVLHVRRLHVEGVPRIALADAVDFDPEFEGELARVDNALEHLVIVPTELHHHPERRVHWEAVMAYVWSQAIPQSPTPLDRRISVCLHWTFLRHVLPDSPTVQVASDLMQGHRGLRAEADAFAAQAVALLDDKPSLVQLFFDQFTDVLRAKAALEYVSSMTGRKQVPIPQG